MQQAITWSTSNLQVSNIRRTKSQHLKDSRTVLKPDVKSRMKCDRVIDNFIAY